MTRPQLKLVCQLAGEESAITIPSLLCSVHSLLRYDGHRHIVHYDVPVRYDRHRHITLHMLVPGCSCP